MNYEIGDTVVHWTHGLGKVIAIDDMRLAGIMQAYYVVEVGLLKLWVPAEEANQGPLPR
jgi:RNA polymerase-interacting CarD/CdnL/TRCF family regulator